MKSQKDFLEKIIEILESADIDYMISGSQKQFDDALGVAAVQWNNLDLDYLRQWSVTLNVE